MNWETESWRQPDAAETDTVLYSEHGRVLDNVCYRSYWFKLVETRHGGYYLLVKHGGGQERIRLGWSSRSATSFAELSPDNRFFMLHALMQMNHDAARNAAQSTAAQYRAAFAEGRLKKRKIKGQNAYKVVLIDPPFVPSL